MARVGRPLKFESVEELEKKIQGYFEACKANKDIPTIAELAVHLDTSRQTLINYEDREEYFDTIKKAKDMCLAIQEKMALKGELQPTVWIFSAKNNFGYADKQEISAVNTNINTDISDLPPEALEEIANARGQEEVMRIVSKYRK